jgi:hypothetical protein
MAEDRDLKYTNKSFSDFRSQLVEYTKNYFPDTYNDFSPASPGMMFIEMASYVGDVLSYYQDNQLQETYLTYAKDPKNLYSLAYMMGYKPKTTGASEATVQISQVIDAGANYQPNWDQAAILPANTTFNASTNSGIDFMVDRKVDLSFSSSYDPTEVIVYNLAGGNPSEYLIRKDVKVISATTETITHTVTTAEKFKTITIQDSNIIGIQSIVDTTNNKTWYEVPFLGQDTMFVDESNSGNDLTTSPYLLKLKKVPRRFVSRFLSSGFLQVQFGAGTNSSDDSEILPDPSNVGAGLNEGIERRDYAYDPSNFTYSKSYGIAPSNATLEITYLKGGGIKSNVAANTINAVDGGTTITSVGGSDTSKLGSSFLTFTNPKPATGGRGADTVDMLRENSLRAFNEQSRTVTLQDYTVRALSLPSKYGSVGKVYVTQDILTNSNRAVGVLTDNNPLALAMYVLSYDGQGKLTTASPSIKQNLKTYLSQFMIITDALDIKDAFVVNIGVNFDIIVRPNYSSRDVLLKCSNKLKELFDIKKWSINQPINLSKISSALDRVKGVETVQKLEVVNKAGGVYAQYAYDVKGATKNNIVFPSYDPSIFEVKYPDLDIKGRVTVM